jgi:SAM-dependent methyltransferase
MTDSGDNQHLAKIKSYWDKLGQDAPTDVEDHWVDLVGNPLPNELFVEIADYILSLAEALDTGGTLHVLEIGCGSGRILEYLEKKTDWNLYGLDISSSMLDKARKRTKNVEYHIGELLDFEKLNPSSLSVIYVHSVTQYFPSAEYFENFLRACYRLLAKSSIFILLDVPIDWYKHEYHCTGTQISLKQAFKNSIKTLIHYKPRLRPAPLTAFENLGGISLEVPTFSAFYVNPDQVSSFAETNNLWLRVEVQPFKYKPIYYKKFRPNFILTKK